MSEKENDLLAAADSIILKGKGLLGRTATARKAFLRKGEFFWDFLGIWEEEEEEEEGVN